MLPILSAQPISRELIASAHHIIVMERAHGAFILKVDPDCGDRIIYLADYYTPPGEVWDPIGQDQEAFAKCRDLLLAALQRLLPQLLGA